MREKQLGALECTRVSRCMTHFSVEPSAVPTRSVCDITQSEEVTRLKGVLVEGCPEVMDTFLPTVTISVWYVQIRKVGGFST